MAQPDGRIGHAEIRIGDAVVMLADEFYGDRMASLTDPFGHSWSFATHIEDVSGEEMQRRAQQKQGG